MKDIIELITKTAEIIKLAGPPTPVDDPSAPIAPQTNKPTVGPYPAAETVVRNQGDTSTKPKPVFIDNSAAAIKEMQTAMQTLSQTVVTDYELDADKTKTSKKSFNNFIAEQYLGTLDDDKKGVEWTTNKSITQVPKKQKTQTDIYELDVVMDTLRRIGSNTKEFTADGRWGQRTNNALKNMLGFAYGLLQLEKDFKLHSDNVYTMNNWNDFSNQLSDITFDKGGLIKLNSKQKEKKAKEITKHLKAITKLYLVFKKQVLSRPDFRPTIEGVVAIDKYNPEKQKENLTTEEQNQSNSDIATISVVYPAPKDPNGLAKTIPLKALKSKEEYFAYMLEKGNTEQQAIEIFNKYIKPKVG